MKAYKGFDKNLQCRGLQYEIGGTQEVDKVKLCNQGLHACEAPLDVFSYYAPGEGSRYCEVEMDGVSDERGGDSKRVAKKLTVGAEIGLRMLSPRELYNAMGFPPDYIIDRDYKGNEYKKSAQVARCGNAVCPPVASALVRANLPEWCGVTITTMAQLMDCVAV